MATIDQILLGADSSDQSVKVESQDQFVKALMSALVSTSKTSNILNYDKNR